MEIKQELISKASVSFLGNIVLQAINFIFILIVTNFLGAKIYGAYAYVLSVFTLAAAFAKLGIPNGIPYFLANSITSIEKKQQHFYFGLITITVMSVIFIALTFIFNNFIINHVLSNNYNDLLFLIMIPSIFIISIQDYFIRTLNSQKEIKFTVLSQNYLLPIINLVLTVLLLFVFKKDTPLILVVAFYTSSIVSIILCFNKLKKINLLKHTKYIFNKTIFFFSLPLFFSTIISSINSNIDKIMIGNFLDISDVGIYTVALQFGAIPSIALASFNTIITPQIANLFSQNKLEEIDSLYKFETKWITSINLLVFGLILILNKDIMRITGSDFEVGGITLIIISIGQIINSAVGSVGIINVMTNHPKYAMNINIISVIINIIMNYFLIGRLGINGAAIATATSLGLNNIINYFMIYKNYKFFPYNKYNAFILIVTAISTTFLYFLAKFNFQNFVIRLIVCSMIYTMIYIALTYILVTDKNEKHSIKLFIKNNKNK